MLIVFLTSLGDMVLLDPRLDFSRVETNSPAAKTNTGQGAVPDLLPNPPGAHAQQIGDCICIHQHALSVRKRTQLQWELGPSGLRGL